MTWGLKCLQGKIYSLSLNNPPHSLLKHALRPASSLRMFLNNLGATFPIINQQIVEKCDATGCMIDRLPYFR